MNSFIGWCREKLGRSTHKAVLMKPVAENTRVYPERNPDGTASTKPKTAKPIKCYEAVAAHYWRLNEKMWKYKKLLTYELHPENTSYVRNEAKLQFINQETGAPISFDEISPGTVFTPEALTQSIAAEWVRNAHASVKGLGMGTVMMIVLFAFGAVVGLLVGMNWEGIAAAVQPSPTPPIG